MKSKNSKHIIWWRSLSEIQKWNITVNYMKHWAELDDSEILKIYNNRVINKNTK